MLLTISSEIEANFGTASTATKSSEHIMLALAPLSPLYKRQDSKIVRQLLAFVNKKCCSVHFQFNHTLLGQVQRPSSLTRLYQQICVFKHGV